MNYYYCMLVTVQKKWRDKLSVFTLKHTVEQHKVKYNELQKGARSS